jgi:fimbrial chaperone protein
MAPTLVKIANSAYPRIVAAIRYVPTLIVPALMVLLAGGVAHAQSLMVIPVNLQMAPEQRATTLAVINRGDTETSIQIRAYVWNQQSGDDQLAASDAVIVSPPLASIAPGATQVVRLILRQPPQGREATYRILLDQIPPPAAPGIVRVVLRMSIPIFAQPTSHAVSRVQFHIERKAGQSYLVALNDGGRHDAVRDVVLRTSDGRKLTTNSNASPYILAGATRRWLIASQGSMPLPNETLRLTARADAGAIERQVSVAAAQ